MDINDLKMTRKEQTEVLQGIANLLDNSEKNVMLANVFEILTPKQKKELLIICNADFSSETNISLLENGIITEEE